MVPRKARGATVNAIEQHRSWLELVDSEGPFLAIPPLKRVWPQGMPKLADDRRGALAAARKPFEQEWEKFDRIPEGEHALADYRAARDEWVKTILHDVAGWAETLSWGAVPGVEAKSPNHAVIVGAQAALTGPGGIGAIVHVIDPVDSLRQTPGDLWAANPVDRVEAMLRASNIEIGIVTDGRWWGLVCAREGAMAASGIVDALTWTEEPRTRDAFFALLSRQHLIGGDAAERLPVLFEESIAAAEEITDALGAQVRRAVELLIQSFSESAADARQRGLPNPLPVCTHDIYEAAVTVMMRTVFLLFAEERGLLPSGELFEQGYGIARELDRLQGREAEDGEEALDATPLTWHRLLATSQALYQGATFENLRMPAYGGSLFDASRFPFLTATTEQSTLVVSVSDRVMLHVLRSVQIADIKGEARRVSFRDIDVEQIGYIYEGLLGYTAIVTDHVSIGLKGKLGEEPEIPLAKLESLAAQNSDPKKLAAAIREFVAEDQPSATPPTAAAIVKALTSDVEPSTASALNHAVGDNTELRDRVRPWLGLVRLDLRRRPFVALQNGLLVAETPSRKNAGAHYTPKSLAEEVVLHALQPICYSPGPHQTADESSWKLKSSDELLSLKVVDIACGSGAFLVAAARYLAERLVEAWTTEDPSNLGRKDLRTRAIRQVVANCLYGADINDMAIEMCKISLWLVSLDQDLPFSFVDDKIFLGNSLLGVTNLDQLRKLHIDPAKGTKWVTRRLASGIEVPFIIDVDVDSIIQRAVDLRRRLLVEIDEADPARSSAAKHRQIVELRKVTTDLQRIADGIIAVGLSQKGKQGKALDSAYGDLREEVRAAYPDNGEPQGGSLAEIIDRGLTPTVETDYDRWRPLHWVLEAPDVMIDNRGFDAVVGNPPFLGGKKISPANGPEFREWIANTIGGGVKGSADMVAYFFLRALELLTDGENSIGMIATDTIAQGDTREVGLEQMMDRGLTITRSVQSRKWPAKSAQIRFSAIWGTTAHIDDGIPRVSDGVEVRKISSLLEPLGRTIGSPLRLLENDGICHIGSYVMGTGFVVNEAQVNSWIAQNEENGTVLRRYLSGMDVNQRPDCSASRWVVDFTEFSESEASNFQEPYQHVRVLVYPERRKNKRKQYRDRWWQFGEPQRAMRRAISGLQEVLTIALVSKTVMPVRVPTDQVLNHKLGVFATDSYGMQAVLSSSVHQAWAIKWSSTQGEGVNYSPTDVFATFPFPVECENLRDIGVRLERTRSEVMLQRKIGLTDLYNMINSSSVSDPDIVGLRGIHSDLDVSVVAEYGWDDIALGHGFHRYRQNERWTVSSSARIEILDRLLEENFRRASLESVASVHPEEDLATLFGEWDVASNDGSIRS